MNKHTSSSRILVVEDSATTRLILEQGLTQAGYDVIVAENGYQALLAFQNQGIELILMDVNMPVMDGFTCCEALRNSEQGKAIPIILLTGLDDHESINKAFEIGASDFMSKPINLRLLVHRIRYALRDAQRERALLTSKAEQSQLIEQLQATQTHLIQSEKFASIGLLAAGIAHEINNPLASVKENVSCLKRYFDTLVHSIAEHSISEHSIANQLAPELAEMIDDAAELNTDIDEGFTRIQEIIGSLLSLSNPQQVGDHLTDVEQTITESLNYCLKTQGYVGQVTTQFESTHAQVKLKKTDLLQILNSILINAVEAAGTTSDLTIRSYLEGKTCHIEICDQGPGISDTHIERIFDPFFTTKEPGKGTGLGLSLTYQLVKHAQGQLTAINLNQGACFTIILPID